MTRSFQPSLRDFAVQGGPQPGVETPGYYHDAPPGLVIIRLWNERCNSHYM